MCLAYYEKEGLIMKQNIHPEYHEVTVTCACGETFKTGSTKKGDEIKVDICNKCHPYFTGAQKIVDAGGSVYNFNNRYKVAIFYWCKIFSCTFYCVFKFFANKSGKN